MAYDAIQEPEIREHDHLDYDPNLMQPTDGARQLVNWLFPIYTALIVAGVFALRMKSAMPEGQEMSITRAVTTAVDAATLSGFRHAGTLPHPNFFLRDGKIVVLALNVAGSLFSMIVGGLAVSRILRLPFRTWQVVFGSLLFEASAAALGYYVLREPDPDRTSVVLTGLSRGIGAFGNYGIALGKNPIELFHWQMYAVVLPLCVAGGLGVTVLMELLVLPFRRQLSGHARTAIVWTFGLYVGGTLAFALIQWSAAGFTRDADKMRDIWSISSSIAVVTRTAGLSEKLGYAFPRAMEWLMMVLMIIGACPGGTGGGLKTTTLAAVGSGAKRLLRGGQPGRQLGIALTWIGIYLGILLLGVIGLLYSEPQSGADRVLMLAISALSNVGLSHDRLSMSVGGMYILSALMLAGRMAPLVILWWMADTTTDADLAVA